MELTLFFTRGVSLGAWERTGILGREVALYRRLAEKGMRIRFVTYGKAGERCYRERLPGFGLHYNRWALPETLYATLAPRIHGAILKSSAIVKSNQVLGADVALAAARRYGKPFVARCGYLHSDFIERAHGKGSKAAQRAELLERTVFEGAARIIVTTESMRSQVIERYRIGNDLVRVIPNYVDTERFQAATESRERRICFVGRLAEQKDPYRLLEAMRGIDAELVVAGDGQLRQGLEAEARRLGLKVRFLGVVPNEKLPEILGKCRIFVLPSRYEGHPKTLIEAMASGLAVVGVDSSGIRDVIRHNETGLLCQPGELRDAIAALLDNDGLCAQLGRTARRFAEGNFALDRVAVQEYELLSELIH